MVAVKEHSVFPVLSFVFDNLHEVLLQLLNDDVKVGVEVFTDKNVDAVFVNETFSSVTSVNFADDVAGGHGLKCLVMVAKIAVIMNHSPRAFPTAPLHIYSFSCSAIFVLICSSVLYFCTLLGIFSPKMTFSISMLFWIFSKAVV